MADGTGNGRITKSGLVFAGLLAVLIISSLWMFILRPWWFPSLASIHGGEIDAVFMAVLVVTGIAFVVTQGLLGYFVTVFGSKGNERAAYWHDNPKAEAILLTITAVVLVVLVFMGQRVWYHIFFDPIPENALVIEVTAQQFAWKIHYAGADGKFGRTDLGLLSPSNPIGIDDSDPASKDDVITENEIHVPVNRPVVVRLRSRDVIHSFFLPNMRVKQDAVPGMAIQIWFTPSVAGTYPIACAELCGQQHYRMGRNDGLTVDGSEEEFNNWMKMKLAGAD